MIHHLAQQNKRFLLIGRQHMKIYPDDFWKFDQRTNRVLLLKDKYVHCLNRYRRHMKNKKCDSLCRCHDDKYQLYAALMSTGNTNLLSRDMMRDHVLLLSQDERRLFRRWQETHQYLFKAAPNNDFQLVLSPKSNEYAQRNGQHWHIPYVNDKCNELVTPKFFLCFKL